MGARTVLTAREKFKIRVVCYHLGLRAESFSTDLFKYKERSSLKSVVKRNKNDPTMLFFQSEDKVVSAIHLSRSRRDQLQIFHRSKANIVEFGYFAQDKQLWVHSVLGDVTFYFADSGTIARTFRVDQRVVDCRLVGNDNSSLVLYSAGATG